MTQLFTYIILLQFFSFGIFLLKVIGIFFWGGECGYIYAYWLDFQEFLQVMLLVKLKYA
jgi:hypothetical protein